MVPTKKFSVSDFELPGVPEKSQCLCNLLGCEQLHPKKGLGSLLGVFSTNGFYGLLRYFLQVFHCIGGIRFLMLDVVGICW